MLFLEHGKHVLCEKPVTMTQDECQQLVDKAREKKLFFMEGIWTRFFPAFRAVREELKTGSLGQITFVRACFLSPARAILKANNKKRCAGGALMARGTYPVQFAQLVFGGKPDKIVAVRQMFDEGLLESPEMTHEDSLNIVAILEEAREQLGMKYEPPQL
nr:hypothetical protein BaRGS_013589 [Batillaria attramentaria]